jgi:hypothetical protein
MDENKTPQYHENKELLDLYKEMKKMGMRQFREMWGQEMLDQLKGLVEDERRLIPIRNKILLQGKLKYDYPMCEKCVFWKGVTSGEKCCPHDDLEKRIVFEKGELSQNPFTVEVCEKFIWKKERA